MIRLIIRMQDSGAATYVGGDVRTEFKTFDLHLPEVERCLASCTGDLSHAQIIGAEILPADAGEGA